MFIRDYLQRRSKNQQLRRIVKVVLDGQLAVWAWVICFYALHGSAFSVSGTLAWFVIATANSMIFGLSRQHYRLVGVEDLFHLLLCGIHVFAMSAVLYAISGGLILGRSYPYLFLASTMTAALWALLRIATRAINDGYIPFPKAALSVSRPGRRTLIVGAGHAGSLVAEELARHPELGIALIGFVDDALEKQGVRIQGYPVLGTSELLPTLIEQHEIELVILAIPSAPGKVIRHLRQRLRSTGVAFKTVPGMHNLLGQQTWTPELRDVSIEDLLRRDPVQLDQSGISRTLKDSVVLITGGGGSIGSEIARQAATFAPRQIVLLGRGENSLWTAQRELKSRFPDQALAIELCDIRNPARLRQAFHHWQPQVVFHAAAHKHVPFLEQHPEEAIENNVFGTKNVMDAAMKVGTRVFVNISSDKSVNPANVLGVSKYLAEQIVREGATKAPLGSLYVSVRFGNVLGSRGSVIPIFKEQIQRGGPVTVTDPGMTRYFMTIPEASQLVLQAGILGKTGKVYVLDMGDPVTIVNLARDMISLSGFTPDQDIEIQFTGVRPGEKLFEELFNSEEILDTQIHDKIFEANSDAMASETLTEGLKALRRVMVKSEDRRRQEILRWFTTLVPTYSPSAAGLGKYATTPARVKSGAA
jgi:FlaA1/EpsC-like NDP-sugar epimerase